MFGRKPCHRLQTVLYTVLTAILLVLVTSPVAASANPSEADTIRALISALEDPEARERLLDSLRALPGIESTQTASDRLLVW